MRTHDFNQSHQPVELSIMGKKLRAMIHSASISSPEPAPTFPDRSEADGRYYKSDVGRSIVTVTFTFRGYEAITAAEIIQEIMNP